jgi:hypothetical protein
MCVIPPLEPCHLGQRKAVKQPASSVRSSDLAVCGGPRPGPVSGPLEADMTRTIALPFQPDAMTPAQLAAV